MKPSDISADLDAENLYSGFTAPEVLAELARDAWEMSVVDKGLPLRAYQPCSGKRNGHEVVAWCVDEEEDTYLVVFDRDARRVHAVYDGKAKRQGGN